MIRVPFDPVSFGAPLVASKTNPPARAPAALIFTFTLDQRRRAGMICTFIQEAAILKCISSVVFLAVLLPSRINAAADEKQTAPQRPATLPATTAAVGPDAKLLERGREKMKAGDLDDALGKFKEILDLPRSELKDGAQFFTAMTLERRAGQAGDQKGVDDEKAAILAYRKCMENYPDSPLAADSMIRIANIHLKHQRYSEAADGFMIFQRLRPTHRLAPQALFLAAQCAYKLEDFKAAADRFSRIIDSYPMEKTLCAEAMYWLGDVHRKTGDIAGAFRTFTRLDAEYPESQWTKAARGRLADDEFKATRDAQK